MTEREKRLTGDFLTQCGDEDGNQLPRMSGGWNGRKAGSREQEGMDLYKSSPARTLCQLDDPFGENSM
jgi:hypothetical protein